MATQPSQAELEAQATALNARFRGEAPEAVLAAVLREFPGRVGVLSSFGTEAAATLQIVAEVAPSTPVLFLDTRMHFAQTLQHRRALTERLGLSDVRDIAPARGDPRDPHDDLWKTDADACCAIRKVEPLEAVRAEFDVLVTGRKRFHGGERLRLPLFEAMDDHLRLNLLVASDASSIAARVAAAGLPAHPLAEFGYTSIGCWPCTQAAASPEAGVRDGRWVGAAKTECGIHHRRSRVDEADAVLAS